MPKIGRTTTRNQATKPAASQSDTEAAHVAAIGEPAPTAGSSSDAPTAAPAASWREVTKIHPAAEWLPRMSKDELKTLGNDIKQHGMTSPIIFWSKDKFADPEFLDGINRLDAIEVVFGRVLVDANGKLVDTIIINNEEYWTIKRKYLRGEGIDAVDPYEYVMSANIHRRHLTTAQRIEVVEKLIKANPTMSSRRAAKLAGVAPTTATKSRTKLEESGDVSTVDTSIDTKGRRQPAKRTKSAKRRTSEDSVAGIRAKQAAGEWTNVGTDDAADLKATDDPVVLGKPSADVTEPEPPTQPIAAAPEPTQETASAPTSKRWAGVDDRCLTAFENEDQFEAFCAAVTADDSAKRFIPLDQQLTFAQRIADGFGGQRMSATQIKHRVSDFIRDSKKAQKAIDTEERQQVHAKRPVEEIMDELKTSKSHSDSLMTSLHKLQKLAKRFPGYCRLFGGLGVRLGYLVEAIKQYEQAVPDNVPNDANHQMITITTAESASRRRPSS